ncbi:thioredoxin-disulfide reductase [Candidatus Marinamargulisbacteria bacterium SCGC AAA071-K20]|jgi:thioredoxin reductase (NADPH)|nr:thioredoxin-disulfide reductase [Candidatus Marinamargulisbacteria bacterium SCGC AAA071-K20]
MTTRKVVIIGSGPAAHTAAIYAARAELNPLMFEGEMAGGVAAGGQLTTTTEVENFPGYKEISGPELMMKMRDQAEHCGAELLMKTVHKVDLSKKPFMVYWDKETVAADCVIIATGATAKRMGIPGEEKYWQKGMSACAVCDGALPLFRNKPLVVIGGGDSACEEATFLTKFASKVVLLVRRDELRASKVMQERTKNNDKIEILWNTEALEAKGENLLTHVHIKNNKTGEEKDIEANGLFYAIGHTPNTSFLEKQVECDETGYIITTPGTANTSVSGVFACGDVQDKRYRQAITAAGSGCMAALDAEQFLVD